MNIFDKAKAKGKNPPVVKIRKIEKPLPKFPIYVDPFEDEDVDWDWVDNIGFLDEFGDSS